MYTMLLNPAPFNYKNIGQQAELTFRFNMTGKICKADNTPFYMAADCSDIQIKSARATICKGTDLSAHLAIDKANRYAYVVKDFSMAYMMTKEEYIDFVAEFGTVTRDSAKNGGGEKIRLRHETKRMLAYLQTMAE